MDVEKELREALERLKKEKENPDYYTFYTDEKIKSISESIE